MRKARFVQLDLGQNDLGFSLPKGSPIIAGFSGVVEIVKGDFFVLLLTSNDGQRQLRYTFSGTLLVSNGERVEEGKVLARAGAESLPKREVNLIVRYLEKGRPVSLNQEIIERLQGKR